MRKFSVVIFGIAFLLTCCSKGDSGTAANVPKTPLPKIYPFPTDVPIYPYSQGFEKKTGPKDAVAKFVTTSPLEAIVIYYNEKLKLHGWKALGKSDQKDKAGLLYKKKKRMLHLHISEETKSSLTTVTIIING